MSTITQAVILAGGRGTRMRPFTDTAPKPMVPIHGRPFLEYLVKLLKKNSIKDIIFLLGYLPKKIQNHFGDGSKFNVNIQYSVGTPEDKTGTRIRNASDLLDDHFLLMYCDNYWPLNLQKLSEFHFSKQVSATITVYTNKDKTKKNNILVDGNGYVITYDKTRRAQNLNGIEIGFYVLEQSILGLMPSNNFSFEKIIIPQLIRQKQLAGFLTDHKYYSIGSPDRIPLTEKFLSPRKVILLDRDGVINTKPPKADYVKSWYEFEFLPGVLDAIKLLTQKGYEIYIISNQAGIARGKMSEDDLEDIHKNMIREIEKYGGRIDGIYYCPHGWDSDCNCRKPKPGMLFQASREHHFDVTKAIFIGDDERDKQAGDAVNCRTILTDINNTLLRITLKII